MCTARSSSRRRVLSDSVRTWIQLPPGVGLDPSGCGMLGYHPLTARHAGIPPAMHAEIPLPTPPLWTEFLTHATENITLPQTLFAGGN